MDLPIAFGKTISNETYSRFAKNASFINVFIFTGQGKSVGLNFTPDHYCIKNIQVKLNLFSRS